MTTSSHPIQHTEASISLEKQNAKGLQWLLYGTVLLTVVFIIAAIVSLLASAEQAKAEAKSLSLKAQELRRINAQPIRSMDSALPPTTSPQDDLVYLSVFSVPPGAELYKNGRLIGHTPIEELAQKRSDEEVKFVLVLEDYEPEKFSTTLSQHFVQSFNLRESVAESQSSNSAQPVSKQQEVEGVIANRPLIITNTAEGSGKRRSKKSNSAQDSAIVLPD